MKFLTPLLLVAGIASAEVRLQPVVRGLNPITSIASAGDERLFLTEQTGLVRIFDGRQILDEPFVDVSPWISCCGERGLLSIAFHPHYAENGLAYLAYTDVIGRVTVSRYHVSADDPNKLDPESATPLLQVIHIAAAHNSGAIAFGPDGYLYVGVGDGGGTDTAQDMNEYLGKILRIDVDHDAGYSVPADNPFVNDPDVLPELWASGLRNPWRFSFDRETGDFWIADVGQNATEEIDFQSASSRGGENYGWRIMEGSNCYDVPAGACAGGGTTLPVIEYSHAEGCAVIGGYRYHGSRNPGLRGMYVYSDYCSGTIWGATPDAEGKWTSTILGHANGHVRTFGEDANGEVYLAGDDGTLYLVQESDARQRAVRHIS
jgi:glucose/arabinose dehydrogenase